MTPTAIALNALLILGTLLGIKYAGWPTAIDAWLVLAVTLAAPAISTIALARKK